MIATKKSWTEAEGGGEIPAAYDDCVDDDYVEAFSKRRLKHYPHHDIEFEPGIEGTAPILFEKDRSLYLCVDYRALRKSPNSSNSLSKDHQRYDASAENRRFPDTTTGEVG